MNPKKLFLLIVTAFFAFTGMSWAQLNVFTYQGRLATNGIPLTGSFNMSARIFDAQTNGNLVALRTLPSVDVQAGLFSVEIAVADTVFDGSARWLEITILQPFGGTNVTLSPRQWITPAPYAIMAQKVAADGVGSNSIRAGSIVGSKIANGQVVRSLNGLSDNIALVPGANVTVTTNGNNLQISAITSGSTFSLPYVANLSVNGSNVGRALLILSNTFPSGFSDGIQGYAASSDGSALVGWATSTTGFNKGVLGRANSPDGVGVRGENVPRGTAGLLATFNEGVFGYADQANQSGVNGYSLRFDGVHGTSGSSNAAAVAGVNTNGGIGVYGRSTAGGVAAQFDGLVNARGEIRMNDFNIWLRPGNTNLSHGLGWHGTGKLWAGQAFDGPVLFGSAGGALGTSQFGQRAALSWDSGDNVTVTRNLSACSLTVRGGCDLAEPFDMPKQILKGSVVVIDEANPGHLKLSSEPYDKRVAGIVSGANGVNTGISLTQEGVLESGQNVALTGRVYVLADATTGAIMPGDLLTSASMPGHAMKVTDHTRAHGAVLGKAMTPLKSGRGMVLVLVSLQ